MRPEPVQGALEHWGIGVPTTDPVTVVITADITPKSLTSGKLLFPGSRHACLLWLWGWGHLSGPQQYHNSHHGVGAFQGISAEVPRSPPPSLGLGRDQRLRLRV